MITTIGCTQFVFVSLGILALNVLLKAAGYAPDVSEKFPRLAVQLTQSSLWMFCIPLVWVSFAVLCMRSGKPSLTSLAKSSGIVVTIFIFILYFWAALLLI